MSIVIEESALEIDSLLAQLGYSSGEISTMKSSGVILLPDDPASKESSFVDNSVSLKKAIEAGVRITVAQRQGQKSRYHAHRSAEIIMPMLVFTGLQAFDISKGLIATWLYGQLERFRHEKKKPNAKFSWILTDAKTGTKKSLRYEGPAEELVEILKRYNLKE